MKRLFYLLIFSTFCLMAQENPLFLKNQIMHGSSGDYIVTKQGSHLSLLLLRSVNQSIATLEEITIPSDQGKKIPSWKEWVQTFAPDHTSWVAYEVDLENALLLESYSFTKRGWIHIDEEHFLTQLLGLKFHLGKEEEKKKIGPPPGPGEQDHRSVWTPPKIFESKKNPTPSFHFYCSQWPQDHSQIAGCKIEIYLDQENPSFPFPYWIDIYSPHYNMRVQTIDSGKNLVSPQKSIPRREFTFSSNLQQKGAFYEIAISSPHYYKNFQLYAIDLTGQERKIISLETTQKSVEGRVLFQISEAEMKKKLSSEHRYLFGCLSQEPIPGYQETTDVFVYTPSKSAP